MNVHYLIYKTLVSIAWSIYRKWIKPNIHSIFLPVIITADLGITKIIEIESGAQLTDKLANQTNDI